MKDDLLMRFALFTLTIMGWAFLIGLWALGLSFIWFHITQLLEI